MKHYINKQTPETVIPAPVKKEEHITEKGQKAEPVKEGKEEESVVFPPDVDLSLYRERGMEVENYTDKACVDYDYGDGIGGAVSQRGGQIKQLTEDAINKGYIETCPYMSGGNGRRLFPHNMIGSFNFISIPQSKSESSVVASMISLINRYKGKYVCLDLWNAENIRIEKCGYLEYADSGYILIRGEDEATMLDLKTIRYINIYCR